MRAKLTQLRAAGHQLVLHFAPPCATFRAARNRSARTRVRSREFPGGLPNLAEATAHARLSEANAIALETFALAS